MVAHTVMNAFFVSNDFRDAVEVYIVLDSSEDFPRTIRLSSSEGLSLAGFHEEAIIELVEKALKESQNLQKDETRAITKGLQISGSNIPNGFYAIYIEAIKPQVTLPDILINVTNGSFSQLYPFNQSELQIKIIYLLSFELMKTFSLPEREKK